MKNKYSIGQLAKESDCKVQTLRYYEEIELIPKPERNQGNQRIYNESHRKRINFIRHSRQLGFSLDQIRQILELTDDPTQPCDAVNSIAKEHLDGVTYKIARLQEMQKELERIVNECASKRVAECRIIEVLADHNLCHTQHKIE